MVYNYGDQTGDTVTDAAGNSVSGVQLTVWTAKNGTQITALQTQAGSALPGYVTTNAQGRYPFRIVAETWPVVWMKTPAADWYQAIATEAQAALGSVLTGFAAVQTAADTAIADVAELTPLVTAADERSEEALEMAETAAALAGSGQWEMSTPKWHADKLLRNEFCPQVLVTSAGTVMVTAAARTAHNAPADGEVVIRRSTTGGRTWSRTSLALTGTDGLTPHCAIEDTQGRIILVTDRITSGVHDDVAEVIFYRSTDDGLTWAEIVRYAWTQVSTIGNIIRTPTGRLLAPYHGDDWGMIYSDNDGTTWTRVTTTNGGNWMKEGRLHVAPDGSLIGIGRDTTANGGMQWFRSTDDGLTWSVGVSMGLGELLEGTAQDGDQLVMVTISRATLDMYIREASIAGLITDPTAWGAARYLRPFLAPSATGDVGYPDMAWLSNGDIIMAWYGGWGVSGTDRDGPSLYTSILSRSAVRVLEANQWGLKFLGQADPDVVGNTSTATVASGTIVAATSEPLYALHGQVGKVYVRLIARVKHTVSATTVTLWVGGMNATNPIVSVPIVCTTGGTEYAGDSKMVEIPGDYADGSTESLRREELVVRAYSSQAGTATVMHGTSLKFYGDG